jgi:polyphosphate kinase
MPSRVSEPKKTVQKAIAKRTSKPAQKTLQLSRERSWLTFNHRVLLQATRPDFPILERVRFLAIFANNLDEFFTARVHPMQQRVHDGVQSLKPEYIRLLDDARNAVHKASNLFETMRLELHDAGIQILEPHDLEPDEGAYFGAYLAERVAPMTDLMPADALAFLDSRALYMAGGQDRLEHLFRVPDGIPRLLEIPGRRGSFVRLEALISSRADLFVPDQNPVFALRVTRRANIELKGNMDWEDLAHALESRLDGPPARLEVETGFPWLASVGAVLGLWPEEIFEIAPPLDHRCMDQIANLTEPALHFPDHVQRKRKLFHKDPLNFLEKQDLVLYHPSDDYGTVVSFVQGVAQDPQVNRIRATLYRLGRENPIAEGLLEAARNGKDVAVFLEGRARFDELANLYWQLRFKEGGVRVLPYPPDLKVHAKALYIRRGGKGFVHLGTGNYNPATGKLYTDLSVLTAHDGLARDASTFFKALEQGKYPQLELMKVGPQAREAMLERIAAESYVGGHIILKLNHLTDPKVLDALERAAESGAKVELIIRSTLTRIHPAFHVRSLIGRFLEHSRIAAFRAGGRWEVWAGSADWMPRNFERRLELVFPVLRKKTRSKVLRLLKTQLQDDCNAFVLNADGTEDALWGGTKDSQLERL